MIGAHRDRIQNENMQKTILKVSLFFLLVNSSALAQAPATDWSQPPVACVEEIVPYPPEKPCLDLTMVPFPQKDWPSGISESEKLYWRTKNRALQFCRGSEVLRREKITPGTFPPSTIEFAWMQVQGVQKSSEKVTAIYDASSRYQIPAQVLTGALFQESMFAELGIAEDGGNYSCGIGQINLSEWCRWANKQPEAKRLQMAWPQKGMACELLSAALIKPFYDIAKTRLNGLPEYRLNQSHFVNIPFESVIGGFPQGSPQDQRLRYQSARSFIDHCEKPANVIPAKAHELQHLYQVYIPSGLKNRETYKAGEGYRRTCLRSGFQAQYPLHSGWLMAIGSYNAGPKSVDALAYYQRWKREHMQDPAKLQLVTPNLLVESLYWSGKYDSKDDRIYFTLLNGRSSYWNWFKLCVLQRHIARVVTHTLIPGSPLPVDSLEGEFKCARSVFDPNSGELVKSGVPLHRQTSEGQIALPTF